MRSFVKSTLIAMLAVMVLALPARAGLDWCDGDPIVALNGTQVQILVSIPQEYAPLVNGPIRVEVETPRSTSRRVLYTDRGFGGHGEAVKFKNRGHLKAEESKLIPTRISVSVPVARSRLGSHKSIPVRVTVIPDNASPVVVKGTPRRTRASLIVAGR